MAVTPILTVIRFQDDDDPLLRFWTTSVANIQRLVAEQDRLDGADGAPARRGPSAGASRPRSGTRRERPATWSIRAANNRTLAHAARLYPNQQEARTHVQTLREGLDDAGTRVFHGRGHSSWLWVLDSPEGPIMNSARMFGSATDARHAAAAAVDVLLRARVEYEERWMHERRDRGAVRRRTEPAR